MTKIFAQFLAACVVVASASAQNSAAEPSQPLTPGNSGIGKEIAPTMDEATRNILQTPEKDPHGWSFTLEPYLWAIGISGQIGIKGFGPANVDFGSKTILQHLDWGVMARGEIRKGRWGILGDGLFAQLSASGDPPAPLYENASVKIQQGMASLALSYRIFEARQGFLDVYAGARFNYMGINLGGNPDSSGIQNVSDAAVQKISNAVGERVDAYLSRNASAIESAIVENVSAVLSDKALTAAANFRENVTQSLGPAQITRIMRELRRNSSAYRELVAATADARLSVAQAKLTNAKEQLPSAVRRRLESAQKKFARALAKKIEENLPTSVEGEQWWVDPIIGLRGQINFIRWLFLAAQGDVGGFGAGSDIAWAVQASVGVNFTRNIFAEAGYRFYYMDYANDGAVYNAGEFGVFSGIGVRF